MKIVHIAPVAPYNEGWGYQENLLPKYQQKLGHECTLIVTDLMHGDNGMVKDPRTDFFSIDGFRVIRRKMIFSKIPHLGYELSRIMVYDLLEDLSPDFIFFHGVGNRTIFQVIRYIKKNNKKCYLVQDNHLDYNIGFNPKKGAGRIASMIHSAIYSFSNPYTQKVYGVTPWRKEFAEIAYGVPKKKSDVLIMGADDEKMQFKNRIEIREELRQRYDIKDNEFLIVTGGKLDEKKKVHLLMEAVSEMPSVKLIVFGNVAENYKNTFYDSLNSNNVIYVGFIPAEDSYKFFYAADLVCFPGQHSVLWEQACASKVPCVFAKWDGMDHVNNGGNAIFIEAITAEHIKRAIKELVFSTKYEQMKRIASSDKTDIFLYSRIAKKSLEVTNSNESTVVM